MIIRMQINLLLAFHSLVFGNNVQKKKKRKGKMMTTDLRYGRACHRTRVHLDFLNVSERVQ